MTNLLGNSNNNPISSVVDPFKQDCIDGISIYLHKWVDRKYWKGTIKFKNKNFGGNFESKEYNIDQFDECIKELKEFINSIPK